MKLHCQQGVGNTVHQAEVLSFDDEELLWSKGILSIDNSKKLLKTLVFVLDMHCALRAGNEHRPLHSIGIGFESQFCWKYDYTGFIYL